MGLLAAIQGNFSPSYSCSFVSNYRCVAQLIDPYVLPTIYCVIQGARRMHKFNGQSIFGVSSQRRKGPFSWL